MTVDSLANWRRQGVSSATAQDVFDRLPTLDPADLTGSWNGVGMPTGHPLDGLLELYGWRGKRFGAPDDVDPLLFRRSAGVVALDPALIPYRLILRPPRLAREPAARRAFGLLLPLLRTSRPGARLRSIRRGDRTSAAMIYDALPIIDHFRRVDDTRVLGLMDYRDMPAPFFFLLTRA